MPGWTGPIAGNRAPASKAARGGLHLFPGLGTGCARGAALLIRLRPTGFEAAQASSASIRPSIRLSAAGRLALAGARLQRGAGKTLLRALGQEPVLESCLGALAAAVVFQPEASHQGNR